jgi:16S rRNA G966 N2-methylase RsmD
LDAVAQTATDCGVQNQVSLVRADVLSVLADPIVYGLHRPIAVVSATPPYDEVDYPQLLEAISSSQLLERGAMVIVEYPSQVKDLFPYRIGPLYGVRNRKYGRTHLAVYACRPPPHRSASSSFSMIEEFS